LILLKSIAFLLSIIHYVDGRTYSVVLKNQIISNINQLIDIRCFRNILWSKILRHFYICFICG